jgi:exodeoxyribonuclease VII large subunit
MTPQLTLNELTRMVRSAIYSSLPEPLWVIAEISEINLNRSGHCYLELSEKDLDGKRIIARMKAVIWANVYRNLSAFFLNSTGYALSSGIKVLALVQVEFHEVYGMSLNIRDIDPSFTLGDMARQKQETINRLKEAGVYEMNKSIQIPTIIQRIAVISSETAAGYGDFMNSLHNNPFNVKFLSTLFPAIMQGDKAEFSIMNALSMIFHLEKEYDVVVIIRGGGAQAELDCFNNYDLAFYITQFPIPVLTGIGHERDQSVSDMVAALSLKTPTAVADFIINLAGRFLSELSAFSDQLILLSKNHINQVREELRFKSISLNLSVNSMLSKGFSDLNSLFHELVLNVNKASTSKKNDLHQRETFINFKTKLALENKKESLNRMDMEMNKALSLLLSNIKTDLSHAENSVRNLDPIMVLKRGFSISRKSSGRLIKHSSELRKGDLIDTQLFFGSFRSRVENTEESDK